MILYQKFLSQNHVRSYNRICQVTFNFFIPNRKLTFIGNILALNNLEINKIFEDELKRDFSRLSVSPVASSSSSRWDAVENELFLHKEKEFLEEYRNKQCTD